LRQSRIIAPYFAPFLVEFVQGDESGVEVGCGVDGFDVPFHRVPILTADQSERVPDQVNNAGLDNGSRPDVCHDLGEAFEAVADEEEHIGDAAVLQVDQHAHPNFAPSPPAPIHKPSTC
jgi:hypothetical protein